MPSGVLKKLIIFFHFRIRENISEELKDLILKLLEMNEERRLTATQILTHQWLLSEDTMSELDK